jgi:hypothetical protein
VMLGFRSATQVFAASTVGLGLLGSGFSGHAAADSVQAALERQNARVATLQAGSANEDRVMACIKFVKSHGGPIKAPTRDNICDQAQAISKSTGAPFPGS